MELRVVFDGGSKELTARRLLMDRMSFEKRPDLPAIPRRLLTGGLAVGTAALAIRSVRRYRGFRPAASSPPPSAGS